MATEKRLIRADVTVEAFTKWLTSRYDGRMPADIVDEIPTVDAVEVVRCKDCLWSKRVDCREPRYACRNICRLGCSQWLDSNDFCSYGERRTDENR